MAKATERDNQTDDAMPQDMADEAMQGTEEEWETVKVGIGREWDFDKDGKFLVGIYQGPQDIEIAPEKQQKNDDGTMRTSAKAHIFATVPDGEQVFLWGSHELDGGMDEIGHSEKVRISFLGRESFTSDAGPRQVKRYKVEKAAKK